MQSSLTVNSQYAVSHGGHVMVRIMFILPYWSTKILPSHSGDIQRDFRKTDRKILTFSLLQKYDTFRIGVGKYNLYECCFEKVKKNNLKKHNQIKLRGFILFPASRFFYLCCTSFILFILQTMHRVPTNLCVLVFW